MLSFLFIISIVFFQLNYSELIHYYTPVKINGIYPQSVYDPNDIISNKELLKIINKDTKTSWTGFNSTLSVLTFQKNLIKVGLDFHNKKFSQKYISNRNLFERSFTIDKSFFLLGKYRRISEPTLCLSPKTCLVHAIWPDILNSYTSSNRNIPDISWNYLFNHLHSTQTTIKPFAIYSREFYPSKPSLNQVWMQPIFRAFNGTYTNHYLKTSINFCVVLPIKTPDDFIYSRYGITDLCQSKILNKSYHRKCRHVLRVKELDSGINKFQ